MYNFDKLGRESIGLNYDDPGHYQWVGIGLNHSELSYHKWAEIVGIGLDLTQATCSP